MQRFSPPIALLGTGILAGVAFEAGRLRRSCRCGAIAIVVPHLRKGSLMINEDSASRIAWFAQHLGRPEASGEEVAVQRGWLDRDGRPTDAGRELLRQLRDQVGTRSVFRGAV